MVSPSILNEFYSRVYGGIAKATIRKPDRVALLQFLYETKIINQKRGRVEIKLQETSWFLEAVVIMKIEIFEEE